MLEKDDLTDTFVEIHLDTDTFVARERGGNYSALVFAITFSATAINALKGS